MGFFAPGPVMGCGRCRLCFLQYRLMMSSRVSDRSVKLVCVSGCGAVVPIS